MAATTPDLSGSFVSSILSAGSEGFAGALGSWLGSNVLSLILTGQGSETLHDISATLDKIELQQQQIIKRLTSLSQQITWSEMILEQFQAGQNIANLYSTMQRYASDPSSADQSDISTLQDDILNPEDGVGASLDTLDSVVTGEALGGDGTTLFEQFITVYMNSTPVDQFADMGLSGLYTVGENFLAQVLGLELKGLSLLASAYLSGNQTTLANRLLDKMTARFTEHQTLWAETMPSLVLAVQGKSSFVAVVESLGWPGFVLYGDPPRWRVWVRSRHPNNTDEEWVFLPFAANDGSQRFQIKVRTSGNWLVQSHIDVSPVNGETGLFIAGSSAMSNPGYPWRIVPQKTPNGWQYGLYCAQLQGTTGYLSAGGQNPGWQAGAAWANVVPDFGPHETWDIQLLPDS